MKDIDKILNQGGKSSFNRVLTDLVWGFNHRNVGLVGLENDDTQGLYLLTRPELNLSYDNLKNVPEFDFLYKGGPYSMGAVIRAYLDPISSQPGGEAYTPLVDHRNPFIPMLSNLILDFSGTSDISVPLWTSDTGKFDEQYFIPTGISGVYNIWESNATFRNVKGDPVTALFFVWATYINRVAEHSMVPWHRNLVEDELDSTTRVYRVVADITGNKYTKISCSIASIPTASTVGSSFDMNSSVVYSEANKTVSVPFTNAGAWYFNQNIVDAIDKLTVRFNPDMEADEEGVINRMQLLSPSELKLFNWDAYLRLNPINQSIEWYVDIDKYERVMRGEENLTEEERAEADIKLSNIMNAKMMADVDKRFAKLHEGLAKDLLQNNTFEVSDV